MTISKKICPKCKQNVANILMKNGELVCFPCFTHIREIIYQTYEVYEVINKPE